MRGGLQGRSRHRTADPIGRAFAFVLLAACCGCATGASIETAAVDRETLTGSVSQADSDETTIRNAVSSADIAALGAKPISWANRDTGSAGTIDQIAEFRKSGDICRRFRAVRESYEGVSMYAGVACLSGGAWSMTAFEAL